MEKRVYIKTFGCQMNEQDTLKMYALLLDLGYVKTQTPEKADLILLNTCSIRAKAEQKIYSDLGRLRPLKEKNPELIIGVTGCVAQQEKQKIAQRFPLVDLVMGTDQVFMLPKLVSQVGQKKYLCQTDFVKEEDFKFLNVVYKEKESKAKAFVNIQKGCDNFCAYCIVPYVRGQEISRSYQDIITEIQTLTDRGVKEVTLLGQNVNSYGVKGAFGLSFTDLLYKIAKQTRLKRLRFATSHPKDMSDDLIEAFGKISILAPQLHLPLQSGSDKILKLMNRKYTRKHYMGLIEKLKKVCPHIVLSTDLIVGFPQETNEDFKCTLDVMQEVMYSQIYSFIYSPRPHTLAAKLSDDVSLKEKQTRLSQLQDLDREIVFKNNQKDVNATHEVLVESVNESGSFSLMGRTLGHKIVHFTSVEQAHKVGDIVTVKITKANPHSLFGEVVV